MDFSGTPRLSGQAYYDFNSDLINTQDFESYTIRHVFERGTAGDVSEVLRCYGDEKVTRVVKEADQLTLRAVRRAKTVLHIHDEDFACMRNYSEIADLSF